MLMTLLSIKLVIANLAEFIFTILLGTEQKQLWNLHGLAFMALQNVHDLPEAVISPTTEKWKQ